MMPDERLTTDPLPSAPITRAPSDATARNSLDETELMDDVRVVLDRRERGEVSARLLAEDLTGQQLGDYLVEKKLGEGGMACVYLALPSGAGGYVALKILKSQFRGDAQLCSRFEREARTMSAIKHDHVVSIRDVIDIGHTRAIVMEWLENGSLRDRLAQNTKSSGNSRDANIGIEEAAVWIVQAAYGVEAAHQLGIIHRDIKPSNLLIDTAGALKVADFGAIRVLESASATWLTGVGQQIGTPGYMSPEQCTGDHLTPAGDVYSLGATLFEILTGRLPFEVEESSPFALMLKHVSEPAPDPRHYRRDIPEWLSSIVLCTLAKSPDKRYATAGRLAEALEAGMRSHAERIRDEQASPVAWHMDIRTVRKQLLKLPQRAIVCWACRCARRVQVYNEDPRVAQALTMAESTISEKAGTGENSLARMMTRIRKLRAASLRAAYTDDHSAAADHVAEAARSAAAAASCAAAQCVDDAAADAAFTARSAIAAIKDAGDSVREFWRAARDDFQMLEKARLGKAGTLGDLIPAVLFDVTADRSPGHRTRN